MQALPFGASAAVHHFNRASEALEAVLMLIFGIPTSHCFDDFAFLLPKQLAGRILEVAKEVFGLLGWPLKANDAEPSAKFEALRVEFDLSHLFEPEPKLVVANTERRANALTETIAQILGSGSLSQSDASKLRGKLGFTNSQAFGRCGALALCHLGKRAERGGSTDRLDAGLKWSLEWWLDHPAKGAARAVPQSRRYRPLVLFTDGACESISSGGVEVSYAALLYDPVDNSIEFFWKTCGPKRVSLLTYGGEKKQVISQAELLPAIAARAVWKERFRGRKVLHFVDNEGARNTLIKGSSPSLDNAGSPGGLWG